MAEVWSQYTDAILTQRKASPSEVYSILQGASIKAYGLQ
jgi:hypothetical protein